MISRLCLHNIIDTVSEYEDSNKTGEMAAKAGLERSASVEMVEESMKAEGECFTKFY